MTSFLKAANANLGGETAGGINAVRQVRDARVAAAALFNCDSQEVD